MKRISSDYIPCLVQIRAKIFFCGFPCQFSHSWKAYTYHMFYSGEQFPVKLFVVLFRETEKPLPDCFNCHILFLFALEIFIDSFRSCLTCTHGKDNSSRACNSVTAGKYAFLGSLAVLLVGDDTFSPVRLKSFCRG